MHSTLIHTSKKGTLINWAWLEADTGDTLAAARVLPAGGKKPRAIELKRQRGYLFTSAKDLAKGTVFEFMNSKKKVIAKATIKDLNPNGPNGEAVITLEADTGKVELPGKVSVGNYPWDLWKEKAISKGVDKELADLGRALMREAYQHGWNAKLQKECGWEDQGEAMIQLALKNPKKAEERWGALLESDGEIGFLDDEGEFHRHKKGPRDN